jgi:ABC-2 type transport system ATP-binding protein
VELRVRRLSKYYGAQEALQDVTLDLQPGTVALLGPNGSGKTTLLRCLATLLKPDRGQLWFDGLHYTRNLPQLRSQIGYLPQDLDLPTSLTPRRLLEYLWVLKNFTEDGQVANTPRSLICKPALLVWDVDQLLSALGLEVIAGAPFGRLSGGQVRLAGIAQAFLGCPNLLLLDELTHGLDVEERQRVFALVRKHVPGRLILFSTHDPADARWLADRVIVLRRGQVVFFGEVDDFHRQIQDTVHSI